MRHFLVYPVYDTRRKIADSDEYQIYKQWVLEAIDEVVKKICAEECMYQPHVHGMVAKVVQNPVYFCGSCRLNPQPHQCKDEKVVERCC